MEPPSDALLQRLRDWRLCRPADLRRAHSRVRRLARDLPAFDSVWIDALVQLGCLTPFQARVLESPTPEQLLLGNYLLQDELGHGRWTRSWLAKSLSQSHVVVVKRIAAPREASADVSQRGRELVRRAAGVAKSGCVLPSACWEDAQGFYLAAPFVGGTPLSELLVRRGRFPANIVWAIGRQLLAALAEIHRSGIVHGDLRLSQIRLTKAGRAVPVETGYRPVLTPEITLHAGLALESYDSVAPETIGVGCAPTPTADLYALGCLLWQLLAGRPPFPTAEPLAKLAAHQTRAVSDVCEWAPETPVALAAGILQLTARDPKDRPASAEHLLREWGASGYAARSTVSSFLQQFQETVPHLQSPITASPGRWVMVAAGLFAVSGLAWAMADRGMRTELLSVSQRWWNTSKPTDADAPKAFDHRLLFPPLSADGLIVLSEPGPYSIAEIRFAGHLRIQGAEGVLPEIVVRDEPLRLAAETVQLENVRLRFESPLRQLEQADGLVMVHSQQFTMKRCVIDTGLGRPRGPAATMIPATGIGWKLFDPLAADAGRLHVTDCVFQGSGPAIFANGSARNAVLENLLHLGTGPLLALVPEDGNRYPACELRQLTLRESGALLRLHSESTPANRHLLRITAHDCVFGLQAKGNVGLIEFDAAAAPVWRERDFVWNGDGSVLLESSPLAVWTDIETRNRTPVEADEWMVDGLTRGRFLFAGLPTANPADSRVVECDIPRTSTTLPGIDPERLPVPPTVIPSN